MFRILIAYGTRPEAIKLAPVIKALHSRDDTEPIVVVTGQHPEMVDVVHRDYGIAARHDLGAFAQGQTLDQLTARILLRLSPILETERPDAVVVQGDTTSCFAAALAAFHAGIPVIHVEAGMRSGDLKAPFPEEMYRRQVAGLTSLHLASSVDSRKNLLAEGYEERTILVTGSTAIDALLEILKAPPSLPYLERRLNTAEQVVVVTCHRRESWGEPMQRVGGAVAAVAESHPEVLFVVAAHPNPKVREWLLPPLAELGNVLITEPLGYRDFAALMNRADVLLTDSGGVQAEAPTLGKPVLVMRDTTEYWETIRAGSAMLVGTDGPRIVAELSRLLDDPGSYAAMQIDYSPYGDGRAGKRSATAISNFLKTGEHGLSDIDVTVGGALDTSNV